MSKGLSSGVQAAAVLCSGLCLFTSIFQFGTFITELMGPSIVRNIFIMGMTAALIGSQVMIMLVTQSFSNGIKFHWLAVPLITILAIEYSSVFTSQLSFNGNMIAATDRQNRDSPEAAQIRKNIERLESRWTTLNSQLNETKATWTQNRGTIIAQIESTEEKIEAQQKRLQSLDVSATSKAFKQLPFGLTQRKISTWMAVLMSALPISFSILSASNSWAALPGGKPGRAKAKTQPVSLRKKLRQTLASAA